jgi:hypothetical protein
MHLSHQPYLNISKLDRISSVITTSTHSWRAAWSGNASKLRLSKMLLSSTMALSSIRDQVHDPLALVQYSHTQTGPSSYGAGMPVSIPGITTLLSRLSLLPPRSPRAECACSRVHRYCLMRNIVYEYLGGKLLRNKTCFSF